MAAGDLLIENYLPVVRQNKGIVSKYPIGAGSGVSLALSTITDSKPVTVNSRNYTQASGTGTALQTKPAQTVTTTGSINGAEFSPRVATGIGAATVVGVLSTPLLKGTGSTITGNFEGFQAALTDSQTSGNTIGGNIVAFRAYQNMASQTVTGDVTVLEVDAAGSTLAWTQFAVLPDDGQISNSTASTATAAGYIKVKIGSAVRYIQLYSGTPS